MKCLKKIISKKLGLLDSTFYDDKIELTQIGDQLAASKNGRFEMTTEQAKFNIPMIDCNSCNVID